MIIRKFFAKFRLDPSDLAFHRVKASGPGGQSVNKTNSAVRMTHIPTGLTVKAGKSRDAQTNRHFAVKSLTQKVQFVELGQESRAMKRVEKERKQKDRRRRRSLQKYNPEKDTDQ